MPIPFSCGDEVGLTLLDIVELQARSNHIQAALCTVNRTVDATDWAAAIEAISIGQLEGGDWTGALHTAKLIPAETNRNSVLMGIAFEQARSGNVQGAIETVSHVEAPLRRNAVLLGVVLIRAKDGDISGALAAASSIESQLSRARAYRNIAAVQTENGHRGQAHFWINRLTSPIEKSYALHGVENGFLDCGLSHDASCEEIHTMTPSSY